MKFDKLLLAALAVLVSAPALAIETGFYLGGNVGEAKTRIDDEKIYNAIRGAGRTPTSITNDDHDVGYKLFGGYQFTRYFALEGGYFNLGEFSFNATSSPPGSLNGEMRVHGFILDPVLTIPMTDRLTAFGKIGVNYAETEHTFTASGSLGAPPNRSSRDLNMKFGSGLQYDFTEAFGMRIEAEIYRVNDSPNNEADVNFLSLGAVYRFIGERPEPVTRSEPAPYVAPYVAPTPVAAAPPPAKTERICSILDIAFEIKKSAIQKEEKERLKVLGTFLQKYPDTTAVIEGHTDDVGSDEFNQKLSQQRADSVVSYLVDELHIAPSRLKAVGYGESRPIASNSTSAGKEANRRINAVITCARDIVGLAVVPARMTLALEMEFDPHGAAIEPQYLDELKEVAEYMKAHPTANASVEGHANKFLGTGAKQETITPAAAMEISKRRAQNVVDYLVDHLGVERSRLTAEGFGQTRRDTYGNTLAEQNENRRVEIVFTYPTAKDAAPSRTR